MNKIVFLGTVLLICSGCEEAEQFMIWQKDITYSECLLRAISAGNNLSAKDIRSLCTEATNTDEPMYECEKYGSCKASNTFTSCYDYEKKELESKDINDSARLAILLCKYGDISQPPTDWSIKQVDADKSAVYKETGKNVKNNK